MPKLPPATGAYVRTECNWTSLIFTPLRDDRYTFNSFVPFRSDAGTFIRTLNRALSLSRWLAVLSFSILATVILNFGCLPFYLKLHFFFFFFNIPRFPTLKSQEQSLGVASVYVHPRPEVVSLQMRWFFVFFFFYKFLFESIVRCQIQFSQDCTRLSCYQIAQILPFSFTKPIVLDA